MVPASPSVTRNRRMKGDDTPCHFQSAWWRANSTLSMIRISDSIGIFMAVINFAPQYPFLIDNEKMCILSYSFMKYLYLNFFSVGYLCT